MKVKILISSRFEIVGVMDGDTCPAEQFLLHGEEASRAARTGLLKMLEEVAKNGLDEVPSKWFHEADKAKSIYEFIKGPLRLFFFKGKCGEIAVCTSGIRKSGNKADKASVTKAARLKDEYYQAVRDQSLFKVFDDET